MEKLILILLLAVVLVVGGGYVLNGCTNTVAESLESVASVNSPQNQAAGNTAKLLGEVQAQAEAIRVEVQARAQAELELERERALQQQTLTEQANAQEARHAATMADIEAERIESNARASVAWVEPVAMQAVNVLIVAGLVIGGVIVARTVHRVGRAWATKIEHQANVPMTFNYDPNTLTAPVFLMLVEGKPTLVNPNTGEVILLMKERNAEAARLRYLAAQNAIALQTRRDTQSIIIPSFDDERGNGKR